MIAVSPGSLPASRRVVASCRWRWPAAIAAAGLLLALTGGGNTAAAQTLRLRCTNPASGASWPLVVDLVRRRVDSFAAAITDTSISWRDPRRGSFELERATGRLQFRNASSTGGYFLYYSCQPM